METRIHNIQQVYWNGRKATMYSIQRLLDGSWVHQGKGMVFGWFKTSRGVQNQIKKEEG